jgi:hypothetical protein
MRKSRREPKYMLGFQPFVELGPMAEHAREPGTNYVKF